MKIGNVTLDCTDAVALSAFVHEQHEFGLRLRAGRRCGALS